MAIKRFEGMEDIERNKIEPLHKSKDQIPTYFDHWNIRVR